MLFNSMLFNHVKDIATDQFNRVRVKAKRLSWQTIRTEMLAGITVALALIPESLAFAAIAGVGPMVALYTSFSMAVVIAFAGGRSAMISAATGSMALLMILLVQQHGVEYLFAATILTGILQVLIGLLRLERSFSFIPQTVIAGFVNALGILIFVAQLQQLSGQSWQAYGMVAITLAIVYLFPRLTTAIPAPLIAIIGMTGISIATHLPIQRVGDVGEISRSLPSLHLPQVSYSLETLGIIFPYALALAIVGLLESLLTAGLIDEITDSPSSKNREARGQGIANIVTGCLGGMAGCGMVGQSVINLRSGARRRLSTAVAGTFLLFAIFVLRDWVQQIPMAALAGVMIMVAGETCDWKSMRALRQMPWSEALVMPLTVIVSLITHNLAYGVLAGLLCSTVFYVWRSTQLGITVTEHLGVKTYTLSGQLFFGSAATLLQHCDPRRDPSEVVIDCSQANLVDTAAAQVLFRLIASYEQRQKRVLLIGVSPESCKVALLAGLPAKMLVEMPTNVPA